ncbi:amidohydrolase [Acanthopleuribacter pedis]|uniref:Amidohydrolase family protein n=1 Tax=Acanthopleuribacter pedis TaxID=442870 RepID=A0A8J7U3V8_9BACT|nr:amidohydrolase [Acanthopleuribacter pedis]MBO1317676.1 amidohydrolase family protein [Acanthopleuribacter pedis]
MGRWIWVFLLMQSVWAATDLVIPWATNNAEFRSTIVVNNLNTQTVTVSLQSTRPDGESHQVTLSLEPLSQAVLDPRDAFPTLGDGPGQAVRIQSEQDGIRAGFVVRGTASGSGDSPGQTNAIAASVASRILLFAYTPSTADQFSAPVVVNGNSETATVTFYAYQNGSRFQADPVTVAPGFTPYTTLVRGLFPNLQGDLFLVAESDLPLIGSVFIFNSQREPAMAAAEPLSTVPNPQAKADLVFRNGLVYAATNHQAVAVLDGKIAFLGSDADVAGWIGPNTRVIDLAGKMLLPGFIDNHNHVGEGGEVGCFPERGMTLAAQARVLTDCAGTLNDGQWVIGYGGDFLLEAEAMETDRFPLEVLDAIFPNNPAIIMDYTSHAMFVNSRALAAVGFDANTPHPAGGIIMKDEEGNPTGILMDNAGDVVMEAAVNSLAGRFDLFYQGILNGLAIASENGITTIGDGRTYWRRGMFEAWQSVEKNGDLSARVSLRPWIYPELNRDEQRPFLRTAFQNDINQLLIVNQVKMYIDGIAEYGTCRVIQPFVSTYFPGFPNGLNYINDAAMVTWLRELQSLGYGAHIHAIGDLGIREAMNAIEVVRGEGSALKYNLTHLTIMDPAEVPRFAALNVDADIQVAHASFSHQERASGLDEILGAQRTAEVLFHPVKELSAAGANVVLSSDWTVNPVSPMIAISYTVEEGSLTLRQAINAYTINAAKALGLDGITGSLEVGKSADFAIMGADLTQLSPAQIREAKVAMTVLQGRIVHQ